MTTNPDTDKYNTEIKKVTEMIQTKLNELKITKETTKIKIDLHLTVVGKKDENEKVIEEIQYLTENDCIVNTVETESKQETPVTQPATHNGITPKKQRKQGKSVWNNKNPENVKLPPIKKEKEIPIRVSEYDDDDDMFASESEPVDDDDNEYLPSYRGGNSSTLLLIPRTKIKNKTLDTPLINEIGNIIQNMINWYIDDFKYSIYITLNRSQSSITNEFEIDTYDIEANYSDFSVLRKIMEYDYNKNGVNVPTEFNNAYNKIVKKDNPNAKLNKKIQTTLLRVFSDGDMYKIYKDEHETYKNNNDDALKENWLKTNMLSEFNNENNKAELTIGAIILRSLATKLHKIYVHNHSKMTST